MQKNLKTDNSEIKDEKNVDGTLIFEPISSDILETARISAQKRAENIFSTQNQDAAFNADTEGGILIGEPVAMNEKDTDEKKPDKLITLEETTEKRITGAMRHKARQLPEPKLPDYLRSLLLIQQKNNL